MPKNYLIRSLLISSIIFLFSINLNSQEARGYYVTFENDTVHTTFIIGYLKEKPNYSLITWQIKYKDKNGVEKFLSPKEATEIYFMGRDYKTYRLYSVLNTIRIKSPADLSGRRFFAKPIIEGKLNLFVFDYLSDFFTQPIYCSIYRKIIVNSNMETVDFSWKKLRKNKLEVFSECPELLKLLKAKDSNITTLAEVVTTYNKLCGDE
jgi:hypothetical protein